MSNFRDDVRPLGLALPTESLPRGVRRALVGLTILTLLVVETGWLSPIRAVVVLLFMCTVPGAAVMSFTRATDGLTLAALIVAFSLAACAALASIAVWTRHYEPNGLFIGLALISGVLLFIGPWYRILLDPAGSHSRADESGADE